ncbi:hypothetical protein [Puniceicoccus vermicola]|uniref:Uncharacterized protein n=1 Tax=Puniceicoccus vermicola TaxID=388746 RepID=A0A7X1AZZ5_9BACT|nr:hypothetical protein [Puniceicoccus vermicola]MBC2603085.1 hypothetical protein [Puniceicoccus vermicola]
MNRWLVWTICGINVLLVAFLGWRILGKERRSRPVPIQTRQEEHSVEALEDASESVRVDLLAGNSDKNTDWLGILSRHPAVSSEIWSANFDETLQAIQESIVESPSPLARLRAREIVFNRFGMVPEVAPVLLQEWSRTVQDEQLSSAERRSALVLLVKLILNRSEGLSKTGFVSFSNALSTASEEPGLLPVVVEGWGVLQRRGRSDVALRTFSAEDIQNHYVASPRAAALDLQYLKVFDLIHPSAGWRDYRDWLGSKFPAVRQEAARQIQRTGTADTILWLRSESYEDPDQELIRLSLIEYLASQGMN